MRERVIADARGRVAQRPLYLDTETTGLGAMDEIVEICLVDADGERVLDTLVRPAGRIPPDATAVHGITDAMVAAAPGWPEVWPLVEKLTANRAVGIYNADYDLRMIAACNERWKLARREARGAGFCIMKMYSRFRGEIGSRGDYKWHKLEAAGRACRIDLPNSHRAHADALLARALLHHMVAAGGPAVAPPLASAQGAGGA